MGLELRWKPTDFPISSSQPIQLPYMCLLKIWKQEGPGQLNASFLLVYLKEEIFPVHGFPAFAQQTITCPARVRFARCSLPRATVFGPKMGSHAWGRYGIMAPPNIEWDRWEAIWDMMGYNGKWDI